MLTGTVRLALQLAVYAAAAVLFVTLYSTRARSLLSASGVALTAAGLALERLRDAEARPRRIWLYAALLGLMLGELTWALNYLTLSSHVGGGLLLLAFYVLVGLVREHLADGLHRHVLLEYLLISLLGLAVLMGYARWLIG